MGFGGSSIGNLYLPVDDEVAACAVGAAWEAGVRYFEHGPPLRVGLVRATPGSRAGRFAKRRVRRVHQGGPSAGTEPFSERFGPRQRLRGTRRAGPRPGLSRDGVLRSRSPAWAASAWTASTSSTCTTPKNTLTRP